jgi:hypothetical protein
MTEVSGLFGSPTKGNPWQASCPSGTVLRGIAYRSGSNVDDITGLFCAPPSKPVAGSDISVAVNAADDSGGTPGVYKCPDGRAVSGIMGQLDGGKVNSYPIAQLGVQCRDFKTRGAPSWSPTIGKNKGYSYFFEKGYPWFATGLGGRAGSNLDAIQLHGKDFSQAINLLTTDSGIADGCMGIGDENGRLYQPQSAECDRFMVQNFCQKNPADPRCSCVISEMTCPNKFDKSCISKNGYRTNDMMKAACPNVMNCVQYLALSPGAQQLATNTQQNCSTDTTNTSNTNTNTNTTTSTNDEASGSFWIWVIVILVFVVLAMVAGVVLYSRKSPKIGKYELTEPISADEISSVEI